MSTRVEVLITRAEAGESDSEFAARVAESQRRVFQIAYGVLANSADAEDVAQEVFLRAATGGTSPSCRRPLIWWTGTPTGLGTCSSTTV